MYHGKDTINWLFNTLKVDSEWAIRRPTGFTWWPHLFAQNIDIDGVIEGPDGEKGFKILISTDFLKNLTLKEENYSLLNRFMKNVSLAAPIYDESEKTLKLVSQLSVHSGVEGWMNPILATAACLQLDEVEKFSEILSKTLGGEPAYTGHPDSGMRTESDEILEVVEQVLIPEGEIPPKWTEQEFSDSVRMYMQQPPSLGASDGGLGLTVEFPDGESTSLLQMSCNQPHPIYGSGLLLLQKFRYASSSKIEGYQKALEMNTEIIEKNQEIYGLGSFSYQDGLLCYSMFFPNLLYKPGLVTNLYYTSASRAHIVTQLKGNPAWTADDFIKRENAIERFLRRISKR